MCKLFRYSYLSKEGRKEIVMLVPNIMWGKKKELKVVSFPNIDWKSFVVICRVALLYN